MKITKTKLKQIIMEELSTLNEEDSPMEILGMHDISDSRALIDAVRALMDEGGISDDNSRVIKDWLSRRLQKEPDESLRDELVALRDDMMRGSGGTGRDGRTSYERNRQRRQTYRDEAGGAEAPTRRMTTLQSLGIGEGKITKTQLKQIIKEELEEVGYTGESVMVGYPGELKLYGYLEEKLGEKLAVELTSAVRLTDEDTQEYIMKLASEMIISEELSEVMSPREEIAAQEAAEKEMETYLIDKGVYKGDRNGRIEIFTGIVGEASDVMDDAVASGLFDQYAVMRFINKLHRMIR